MAAPTIIRNTDAAAVSAGAVLTGLAGSLVAVLDYALVTVLGWSKPFSAANKGVYRAPSGVRHYLDVDDSAPDATALGRNARIRGYEVATAVGTGTGPFPTTVQCGVASTSTAVCLKSNTADAVVRPWLLIGDDKTFHLFIAYTLTSPPTLSTHSWNTSLHFGEIYSLVPGDAYRSNLMTGALGTASSSGVLGFIGMTSATLGPVLGDIRSWMARAYLGTGGACWATSIFNSYWANLAGGGQLFPNPIDGGIYMDQILLNESGTGTGASAAVALPIRGRVRGLNQLVHTVSAMNDQDTWNGVGDFVGRTFMVLKTNSAAGGIAVETSAWDFST